MNFIFEVSNQFPSVEIWVIKNSYTVQIVS